MKLLNRYTIVITFKDDVRLAVRPFIHRYALSGSRYSLLTDNFNLAARFNTYEQVRTFAKQFRQHCKERNLNMRWRIIYISHFSGRAINA